MATQVVPKRAAKASGAVSGRRRRFGDLRVALVFLFPAALGFTVFYLWPTLRGFYLSLTEFSLLGDAEFVGLANFERLIGDPLFWNSLRVTVLYVVINIGVQTVVALALAVLMHRLTTSVTIRGLVLLPYLVANVVVALVWFWMLDYQLGVVNQILDWIGLGRISFFGSETWAIPTIALVNVWRHMGYTALLIFAGLQMIPKYVYEASAIDGASEWRMFWSVTLPLLRPIMALVLILSVIGSFQIFDTVAVTTSGGPVDATRVIYFYIFELAFERFDFGYAAAISVVLFLILGGVAIAQLRMLRAGESDLS
ncbi:sugar ABC transporter permease [Actinobacteria bacterium YIM 96077]|uniref:Sugar ABC transporter permease n=1 Tax=Phytoactinopolyspora halophila TaxID=1981511 RepID=A0A329QB35_9ACTN|nr:sugar ABC transporter permease [Phytoactinopolyspora halophila]AYY12493.1 sugar ABC transporter permease [Actinobacteria bacterium YIM 96077]RAW09447.1 sugar ABC transporter permease [Phytoactinopolyspora halophila]